MIRYQKNSKNRGAAPREKEGGRSLTIAEVSKKYGLTADTLRYYERTGLIPAVPRNVHGIRVYDEESCKWIEFVKCMRGAGLAVDALAEYVALCQQGDGTRPRRLDILHEQRDRLWQRVQDMEATLDRLDRKINAYSDCLEPEERRLYQMEQAKRLRQRCPCQALCARQAE